jgi:cell wall-associated NlpC family hydrolase
MDGYFERANEHYTEGPKRWSGITGKVCPTKAPEYSDCSSFVTWIYWTLFGNGNDFMNGEGWSGGYTGTLDQHGTQVPMSVNDLQIGDLCFYYHPMHHVAIYVGGGKVVTHGMDPVGYYAWNYAPVDFCRRYI